MTKQQRLIRLLEGCSSCVYEESDGELYRHCAKCQFEITKLTHEIVVADRGQLAQSDKFNNGLTDAQEEMLQICEEECAELIQAISKIRRHGIHSSFVDGDPTLNERNFIEEAGDVLACIAILTHNKLLDVKRVNAGARAKLDRLKVPGNKRIHFITPDMIP